MPDRVPLTPGLDEQLRNRVAYAICRAIYLGGDCACKRRGARACDPMLNAATSAALTIDEEK